MGVLDKTELGKLSVMYDGDKKRDAADKVRGFLFQDFVAIRCLLRNNVECVCLEYLEDVDVIYSDGRFECIQVKYYPKTKFTQNKRREITTDLYYQFLRFRMLNSSLSVVPKLYYHCNRHIYFSKITHDEMKRNLCLKKKLDKTVSYPVNADKWLKCNINPLKKADQKKNLFVEMADDDSLVEFENTIKLVPQLDIKNLKKKIKKELSKAYTKPDKSVDEDDWQIILLGLAVSFIQQRYLSTESDFNRLKVDKAEFDKYMSNSVIIKSEQSIISYVSGIVCEAYDDIIENNNLSDLQIKMLSLIFLNTRQWIECVCGTVNGQVQLVNTISLDDINRINEYKDASLDSRFKYIIRCTGGFLVFLKYLWKIMLNLCQEEIHDESQISSNLKLFTPTTYVVDSVTDYICLRFPKDIEIKHSVILPRAGQEFKGARRKIAERMISSEPRPGKWFLENDEMKRGENIFDYKTSNVIEKKNVTEIGDNSFYVECMKCIDINEGEWSSSDKCGNCIFQVNCARERGKK